MANIRSFKELRVWQNAIDLAMRVYQITKNFPPDEKYSLTDPFRRASRSTASNLAEAWRKRPYPAAFVSKLNDSESEAAETQTWTEFARRCGYIDEKLALELDNRCEEILGQLVNMASRPDEWTLR